MTLRRRAAVLGLPFALAGCSLFDSFLGENKPALGGKREDILGSRGGLQVDAGDSKAGHRPRRGGAGILGRTGRQPDPRRRQHRRRPG